MKCSCSVMRVGGGQVHLHAAPMPCLDRLLEPSLKKGRLASGWLTNVDGRKEEATQGALPHDKPSDDSERHCYHGITMEKTRLAKQGPPHPMNQKIAEEKSRKVV